MKDETFTTTVPVGKINEADLIALVDQIHAITKVPVTIETQFIVVTRDPNVSNMLDSLMGALPAQESLIAKKNGKTKPAKSAGGNGNAAMTSHQVRIVETGEIISRQAFNKKLEAGEIAEMTNVVNAKGEAFVVIDRALVKGPQA